MIDGLMTPQDAQYVGFDINLYDIYFLPPTVEPTDKKMHHRTRYTWRDWHSVNAQEVMCMPPEYMDLLRGE